MCIGRSNVGKSSFINALANSYGAKTAKVSDKPGETQVIICFVNL
jgi:GTP-binding protein EngB required for normal cell division